MSSWILAIADGCYSSLMIAQIALAMWYHLRLVQSDLTLEEGTLARPDESASMATRLP